MKIALIIGTGYHGEDVLHKEPWVKYIDKSHEVFVASRVIPGIQLDYLKNIGIGNKFYENTVKSLKNLIELSEKFSFFFDSDYLKKKYTNSEIIEIVMWLGISLEYISSFDRRFYNRENMNEKRNSEDLNQYFAILVEYFKDFFVSNKIDLFINTMEDDSFSIAAYFVAKKLKIRFLELRRAKFPRKGINFFENSNICVFNEENIDSEEILSLYSDSTIIGKEVLEKNKEYLERKSLKFYINRLHSVLFQDDYKISRKQILDVYPEEKFVFEKRGMPKKLNEFVTKKFRAFCVKNFLKNPNADKYFLFPLHYTDDAQMTFREPMVEQFDLVKAVSRTLPMNYYLYVKPHPHYLGTDVSFRKLRSINKLHNVKIINPTIPSIKLMKDSIGVITINSATGFEAQIMGIPVITFGHDFYCKENITYLVRDLRDLPEIILNLIIGAPDLNHEKIETFVKSIYSNTIWIDGVDYYYRSLAFSDKDGKKIATALNKFFSN